MKTAKRNNASGTRKTTDTAFDGRITGMSGYTVRSRDGELVSVPYDMEITTADGRVLFLLEKSGAARLGLSAGAAGMELFRDAVLGAAVTGRADRDAALELDYVLAVSLSD